MRSLKRWLGIMLSVMLVTGSLQVPVYAAETGATTVDAGVETDSIKLQDATEGDVLEEELVEEEGIPEKEEGTEEPPHEEPEKADESAYGEADTAEDFEHQTTDNTNSSDTESEEPDTYEEETLTESADQDSRSDDTPVSQEPETAGEPTPNQIKSLQKNVKIWKYENRIIIVYDSLVDLQLGYSMYSDDTDELLYTGNLHWNEESSLYYEAVDFDAVNEANRQAANDGVTERSFDEIDIIDVPVRVVLEINDDQDDENIDSREKRLEEAVSKNIGIVSITDVDTGTDGLITVKWDRDGSAEIDGYVVIVRDDDENTSALVYDTDELSDDTDDDAYTLNTDDQIILKLSGESTRNITVAAYKYDDETGVKYYGEAASYALVGAKEQTAEDPQIVEDADDIESDVEDAEEVEADLEGAEASSEAKMGVVASGKCGSNLSWSLDEDGILSISGTGKMTDYVSNSSPSPWRSYTVKKAVISGAASIGNNAFSNCRYLTKVTIPDSVTSIGSDAFYGCSSLVDIEIPNSVTSIGGNSFYGCDSLTDIIIPDSIKSITYFSFAFCKKLTSVTIPKSVTSIGNFAFFECNNLDVVYYNGSKSDWEAVSIGGSNEPLRNANIVFSGGTLKLDPEFSNGLGESITISATYTSNTDTAITASMISDAGDALEYSGIRVLGPFKTGSEYESYISFTVTGKKAGDYNLTLKTSDGTTAKTVIKVGAVDISNASVKLNCPDQFGNGCDCLPYTGKQVKPQVLEVKVENKLLTLNTDYTISYGQNIDFGEALVTIKGKGNYYGEKAAKFMIVPNKVKNLRYSDTACGYNKNNNVGATHRTVDIEWDAIDKVSGYTVEYSESSTFANPSSYQNAIENKCKLNDGIERGQHLFVRVQAYSIVNGKRYHGPKSDVLEYQVCEHLIIRDFWGFGNPGKRIPKEYFMKFFTPAQAQKMYDEKIGKKGMCYGLSNLAISILHYNYPKLEDFLEKNNVDSLSKILSINRDPSIKDYIYYTAAWESGTGYYSHKNKLDELLLNAEEYTETEKNPFPLDFMIADVDSEGNKLWGHNIVALDIVEKTNSLVKIRVYDPNHPFTDMFISLTGENGKYTKWKYTNNLGTVSGTKDSEEGDYIRVQNQAGNELITSMLLAIDANKIEPFASAHYTDWLCYVSRIYKESDSHDPENEKSFIDYYRDECLKHYLGRELEISSAEQSDDEIGLYFWVPKTSDNKLIFNDAPAGSEIHIAGNTHSVTVSTTEECDLSIYLPETGEAEIDAASSEGADVQAVFYDFDDDGDRTVITRSASVSAHKPATITKHESDEPDPPMVSGSCGSTLTWSLNEGGLLRISGTGKMYDFDSVNNKAPWLSTGIRNEIKSVVIKKGVTTIGEYAFNNCDNLTDISIPDSVTSIGKFAFFSCDGFENVTIPNGVTSIGASAFSRCININKIVIPSSVESIESLAFSSCTGMTSISVESGNANFSSVDGVLFNKDQTELVCCPGGKRGTYSVPEGIVKLRSFAFYGCSSLSGIALPSGVIEIGLFAFQDCSSLTSIVIPSSVTTIGLSTSSNCNKLSTVYFVGTQEGWKSIKISDNNSELLRARVVFVDDVRNLKYAEINGLSDLEYTGKAIKQIPEVHQLCTLLKEGSEYTVVYSNNINAGTATVTISGAGDYVGSVTGNFRIRPASISKAVVSGVSSKTYTGSALTQTPTVKVGSASLRSGTDYSISYRNNIAVGTATMTITGIGNYSGTVTKTFKILPGKTTRGDMFNLANNVKVTWKAVPGAKYYKVYREGITDSRESCKDPVIVTTLLVGWDKEPKLTNGHAYRYRIVASLTGEGDSSGDSSLSYSKIMYRLKTVAIQSAKNLEPGKITVKYDKTVSGDSYVLQYGERKDMVGAKTKVVLGANNTSYTIGGLKKGKTYFVSIRVRKKVGGIYYYTTFGVPKEVKITK